MDNEPDLAPDGHDYTPRGIGAEDIESGDPVWIDPSLRARGARPGDLYLAAGRWRQRQFPTERHPADQDHYALGRYGLALAHDRLWTAVDALVNPASQPHELDDDEKNHRLSDAILAAYEAMEWVHSLDEHLRRDGLYDSASEVDPSAGPIIEGVIGARNASHHGLRRVLGVVNVPRTAYVATTSHRWDLQVVVPEATYTSVRWLEKIPPRSEVGIGKRSEVLRYEVQRVAFEEHLAGRDLGRTLGQAAAFFMFTVIGHEVPRRFLFGPASMPPPIDPDAAPVHPQP